MRSDVERVAQPRPDKARRRSPHPDPHGDCRPRHCGVAQPLVAPVRHVVHRPGHPQGSGRWGVPRQARSGCRRRGARESSRHDAVRRGQDHGLGIHLVFAALAILGIFSINLGPLIAGAGIAGIAVGLGAQQLVKDCISGFFILLEDQCGVGDEIDIGPAIGTVEAITLRATTLRDSAGTVWTVPNGTILRIGNKSRDWSQGIVDITIANPAQLDDAVAVIERVAAEVSALPEVAPALLEPIAVPGVESLGTDGAVIRITARTSAGGQGQVLRTLRATLTRGLDAAGINAADS